MAPGRAERIALNESLFRTANERLAQWEERHDRARRERYHCECGDAGCRLRVDLAADEYESVRAEADRFLVAVGHATPGVETVVAGNERFEVIEKDPSVRDIVEETDPRRDRR